MLAFPPVERSPSPSLQTLGVCLFSPAPSPSSTQMFFSCPSSSSCSFTSPMLACAESEPCSSATGTATAIGTAPSDSSSVLGGNSPKHLSPDPKDTNRPPELQCIKERSFRISISSASASCSSSSSSSSAFSSSPSSSSSSSPTPSASSSSSFPPCPSLFSASDPLSLQSSALQPQHAQAQTQAGSQRQAQAEADSPSVFCLTSLSPTCSYPHPSSSLLFLPSSFCASPFPSCTAASGSMPHHSFDNDLILSLTNTHTEHTEHTDNTERTEMLHPCLAHCSSSASSYPSSHNCNSSLDLSPSAFLSPFRQEHTLPSPSPSPPFIPPSPHGIASPPLSSPAFSKRFFSSSSSSSPASSSSSSSSSSCSQTDMQSSAALFDSLSHPSRPSCPIPSPSISSTQQALYDSLSRPSASVPASPSHAEEHSPLFLRLQALFGTAPTTTATTTTTTAEATEAAEPTAEAADATRDATDAAQADYGSALGSPLRAQGEGRYGAADLPQTTFLHSREGQPQEAAAALSHDDSYRTRATAKAAHAHEHDPGVAHTTDTGHAQQSAHAQHSEPCFIRIDNERQIPVLPSNDLHSHNYCQCEEDPAQADSTHLALSLSLIPPSSFPISLPSPFFCSSSSLCALSSSSSACPVCSPGLFPCSPTFANSFLPSVTSPPRDAHTLGFQSPQRTRHALPRKCASKSPHASSATRHRNATTRTTTRRSTTTTASKTRRSHIRAKAKPNSSNSKTTGSQCTLACETSASTQPSSSSFSVSHSSASASSSTPSSSSFSFSSSPASSSSCSFSPSSSSSPSVPSSSSLSAQALCLAHRYNHARHTLTPQPSRMDPLNPPDESMLSPCWLTRSLYPTVHNPDEPIPAILLHDCPSSTEPCYRVPSFQQPLLPPTNWHAASVSSQPLTETNQREVAVKDADYARPLPEGALVGILASGRVVRREQREEEEGKEGMETDMPLTSVGSDERRAEREEGGHWSKSTQAKGKRAHAPGAALGKVGGSGEPSTTEYKEDEKEEREEKEERKSVKRNATATRRGERRRSTPEPSKKRARNPKTKAEAADAGVEKPTLSLNDDNSLFGIPSLLPTLPSVPSVPAFPFRSLPFLPPLPPLGALLPLSSAHPCSVSVPTIVSPPRRVHGSISHPSKNTGEDAPSTCSSSSSSSTSAAQALADQPMRLFALVPLNRQKSKQARAPPRAIRPRHPPPKHAPVKKKTQMVKILPIPPPAKKQTAQHAVDAKKKRSQRERRPKTETETETERRRGGEESTGKKTEKRSGIEKMSTEKKVVEETEMATVEKAATEKRTREQAARKESGREKGVREQKGTEAMKQEKERGTLEEKDAADENSESEAATAEVSVTTEERKKSVAGAGG